MSNQLQDALSMFIHLSLVLSGLFLIISYGVGLLQRVIPQEKIEALLGGKKIRSYLFALILASITPFCSCSTVPMLRGLLQARAGFGPILLFLFTSPLINPVVIGLLFATFGLKLTLIYFGVALLISLMAGITLEKLKFSRFVRPEIYGELSNSNCCEAEPVTNSCCDSSNAIQPKGRFEGLLRETWKNFVDLLPYLLLGIVIGSLVHGFVPTEFLQKYAGSDNPLAIPLSAIIGIPLYIRIEAIIPLASALLSKGVGAGAVMALIIGSAGASLTEVILLRSLFKTPLIIAFVAVVLAMAVIAGYLTYFIY